MNKFLVMFGVASMVFVGSFTVQPTSVEALSVTVDTSSKLVQLREQLASLLKQVEEIKKQIKEIETSNSDFCFTFNDGLGFGAQGNAVVALHKVLAREGFAVSGTDGQFTEETAAAVSGFQEKYRAEILSKAGLKYGTGYVGVATRAKLNTLYGCTKPPIVLPLPSGNKPPVIHGFESPTQLKVGITGTWSVKASDPENGSLSYSIDWGDKAVDAATGAVAPSFKESAKQQSTFTHVFSYPGEYKVVVTVKDSSGATAQASATTVVVAGEDPLMGTLSVRVLNGSIVCFTAPCEFPLAGATVQVFDLGGTAIIRTGTTDSQGNVVIKDLKPYLTYPVRITSAGYVTQETKVGIVSGSNSLLVRLIVDNVPRVNQ